MVTSDKLNNQNLNEWDEVNNATEKTADFKWELVKIKIDFNLHMNLNGRYVKVIQSGKDVEFW